MDLAVDRDSDVPLGTQLAWRLRAAIDAGELAPEQRLPSLREAAAEAGVNVNTVRAVYAKLEAAGVVRTEQGRGTFVAPPEAIPAADGPERARRRLREEIARLEAELVSLPLLPPAAGAAARGRGARLLSVDELATVRDLLAERVADLRATREEIAARLDAARTQSAAAEPGATPEQSGEAERAPTRPAASGGRERPSPGLRARWTG